MHEKHIEEIYTEEELNKSKIGMEVENKIEYNMILKPYILSRIKYQCLIAINSLIQNTHHHKYILETVVRLIQIKVLKKNIVH